LIGFGDGLLICSVPLHHRGLRESFPQAAHHQHHFPTGICSLLPPPAPSCLPLPALSDPSCLPLPPLPSCLPLSPPSLLPSCALLCPPPCPLEL
jgi:hypothetical protein